MNGSAQLDAARRRVRVWFGEHVIATFVGAPDDAARYEAGMQKRFARLRITSEQAAAAVGQDAGAS